MAAIPSVFVVILVWNILLFLMIRVGVVAWQALLIAFFGLWLTGIAVMRK